LFFGQAEVADPTLAGLDTPERRQAFMASPQDLETSQGTKPKLREEAFLSTSSHSGMVDPHFRLKI
jgi:hypothetical protein